ncbi:Phosphatidylinositol transfer protein beta isoform [Tritrichomonas foetus]|uniref:Phosphatidylinositol transfer protein beta isoform n=1 Tax=Tritrichomonas foetus TaxID=1144522 RepID=A0A1J4JYP1_9EUKA|nr:Phosphatidylinositol transfer protein beta isoform [Tritrichomonas foetus]|eukprot:OHT04273.1 Phosphatidylinositol transfer protein beta isoform [Tritrichomonas foetus]
MKLIEFRIMMPISLDRFPAAKAYMVHGYVKNSSGGGEGIEIVKNGEPYNENGEKGTLNYKIYHVKSQIPGFIRWAVPDRYLHFNEKSYNSYPHCKSLLRVPALKDDFILDVESQHIIYTNKMEFPSNYMDMTDEELKMREVIYIDILNGNPYPDSDPNLDLSNFICPEAGFNTPLTSPPGYNPNAPPKWTETFNGPMICVIKVLKFHFKWWGIQTGAENLVAHTFYPKLFTESHRKIVAHMKDWYALTDEDLEKMGEKIHKEQLEGEGFTIDE